MTDPHSSLPPETLTRVRDSFARQSLMATFEAKLTDIHSGEVTIVAPILPLARQQHDVGHAGLAFSIGDTAAGYAALTLMPAGAEVMTVEMKINLLAPASGDRLVAVGRVIRPGRRLMVVSADVWAETGDQRRHVAMLQGTMIPV